MLRAIINGQSALKQELLSKIGVVHNEVKMLDKKIDKVEENLTGRIDKIGLQVARLEDDAPTREEHKILEQKVQKLEYKIASA